MLGGRPGHTEGLNLIGFLEGLRHWKANLFNLLLLVAVLCPVCISTVSSLSRAFP